MMGCTAAAHHFTSIFHSSYIKQRVCGLEIQHFHQHFPIWLLADEIKDNKCTHDDAVSDINLTLNCLICFSYCFVGFLYCFAGFLQISFRFVYLFGFQLIFNQEMSIINQKIHKNLKTLKNLKTKTLLKKNKKIHNLNQLQDLFQAHKKI